MVTADASPPELGLLSVESGGPGLTVAAVARRLGVAPATLRTWDRRYGLGPSAHSAGAHRRYSSLDVARLDLMRRLVNAGAPPGEAARAALAADVASPGSHADLDHLAATVDADLDPLLDEMDGPHGGGDVIALPTAAPAVRGLARAAMSLDSIACGQIVRDSLDRRGVVWTWDNLLIPVLVGVGRRWENTGKGVEVEHVLSESRHRRALRRRHAAARRGQPAAGDPRLRRRGDALAAAVRRQRRARGASYRGTGPRCPGAARRARRVDPSHRSVGRARVGLPRDAARGRHPRRAAGPAPGADRPRRGPGLGPRPARRASRA